MGKNIPGSFSTKKTLLGNQPISDGENKPRHGKKLFGAGCLCFSYEAYCCTAPGLERKAAPYTWTHERERPLGLGGRQYESAAPYVLRRDQAVGADLLFSWLLLLLLCKPLGRAAPRMVYGAARLPPWRRAPPLAHVYVVAVRAAGLESWPRLLLLLTTSLGSDCICPYSRTLARLIRVIVDHSRFTWTIFFRLPLVEVPSCFFELPVTKSLVVVPQRVTEGAIFRQIVLYGYYVDSSGVCFAVCCTSQCRVVVVVSLSHINSCQIRESVVKQRC